MACITEGNSWDVGRRIQCRCCKVKRILECYHFDAMQGFCNIIPLPDPQRSYSGSKSASWAT